MTLMCRFALLFALLLLVRPALAQGEVQGVALGDAPVHLTFALYAAGLRVVTLESDVDLGVRTYRIDLNFRTSGLYGALVHNDVNSFVQGAWDGARPVPLRFASWGVVGGDSRRTVIDYPQGEPRVTTLEPPEEEDRDPVPVALQRDTVDTLSAMAMLVRDVAQTGRCDGTVTTFDGRRVLRIAAHTTGMETLGADGRSGFAGPALRCDFDGVQTGGFQHDVSEAELRRVHHSTAWLARVLPGEPLLPVRVMFEAHVIGHATAYLTGAAPLGPGVLTVTGLPR